LEGPLVVDTNVFVKLFLPEQDSHHAHLLHSMLVDGRVQFSAPDFLAIEFVNVLWLKVRSGALEEDFAWNILSLFQDLLNEMTIYPSRLLLAEVLRNSIDVDHAAYDMAFVALADALQAPLITADKKMYNKVKDRSNRVVLLRDVSPLPS
jgi:predicted nucleic acid-binding protein